MNTIQSEAQSSSQQNLLQSHSHDDDDIIDLGEYLAILLDSKKLILAVMCLGLCVGLVYGFLAAPQYSANVLVQVEPNQGSGLAAFEDVAGLFEGDSSVEAEIELIRSRLVLQEAVSQLGLDIQIKPKYFPLIGETLARRFVSSQKNASSSEIVGVSEPWFDMSSYAWGGEQLEVDVLEVPDRFKNTSLLFRVGEAGRYSLWSGETKVLEGKVGELAQNLLPPTNVESSSSSQQLFQMHVSQLKARPGTEFTLTSFSSHLIASEVGSRLSIQEKGKKSGILELSLVSKKQIQVAELLNTIADVYVEQNVNRSSAEAELSLKFLEQQLPPLKEQLDAAENAYNLYRVKHGSIDLQQETQAVLVNINAMTAQLLELQQQRNELRRKFKAEHPVIRALDGKILILRAEEGRLEAKSDELPDVQKELIQLAREVEMNTILYSKLLNTTQELKVAKAGSVGNVRVVDHAFQPLEPFKPNKKLILILAGMLAGFGAVVTVFIRHAVTGGIDDPSEIEKKLGLPVYGSITHSLEQEATNKKFKKKERDTLGILVQESSDSLTVESLRSLRTSLYFSLQEASNNIVLMSGPSSMIGKTFLSVNLGAILADAGKKVLVIDADLRRGTLHKYLGVARTNGLSEMMMSRAHNPSDYIRKSADQDSKLDFITSGDFPANPAELFLHPYFGDLLKEFSSQYDYVIIDAPPILAVTDSAIISGHAGTTLMAVKAHHHQMAELEQAQKQFMQSGAPVKGIIFNDVKLTANSKGYGKYIYKYEYKADTN